MDSSYRIILDDAQRGGERRTIEQWTKEYGLSVDEIYMSKHFAVLSLPAPSSRFKKNAL